MALRQHVLAEEVFLPVDGLDALVEVKVVEHAKLIVEGVEGALATQCGILVVRHHILVGIKHIHALRHGLGLQIAIVAHHGLATFGILGGDEDYTIGTLRTVDGGRGSVFQHGDVLDVVRGKVAERTALETVDNDERGVVTSDGATTTHADEHFGVGRTVGGGHLHTRELTSECFRDVGGRNGGQFVTTHGGYRTGKVFLPY